MILIEYLATVAATCAVLWLASAVVCVVWAMSAAVHFGFRPASAKA